MSDNYNHEEYTGEEDLDENEDEFVTEEDAELYEEELEELDLLDDEDAEALDDVDGDEVGYPENLREDDLSDDTTEYSEAEFHDETRMAEHVVEDLDLGEALYYEKDLDYQHMDGTGFEDELENLEDNIGFGDEGEDTVELRDENEEAERNPGPGAEKHGPETSGT